MPPRIGVLPLYNAKNETFWMSPLYTQGIEAAGGIPVILPLSLQPETWKTLCNSCDGFLFPGGQDIDPCLYGQEKLPACHYQAPYRDTQEAEMLRLLRDEGRPVLAICRGLQLMNAVFGGTLYQDLPTQQPLARCHLQTGDYDAPSHTLAVTPGTLLHRLAGQETISVNSMHHQAVRTPAPGFTVSGVAPDGIVEAIELPDLPFFLGIQWHPEFLWRRYPQALNIFRGLVSACE